ncbi:MAG: HAMP domain-containing methyl-accepting chemotaxis protein, partial [Thermoanaerobaculia bacterium]
MENLIDKLTSKSLRFKFLWGAVLILVVFSLLVLLTFNWKARNLMYEQVKKQGDGIAKTVSLNSSYYIQFSLKNNLEDMVQTILFSTEAVYVDFLDNFGNVLAKTDESEKPKEFDSFVPEITIGKKSRTQSGKEVLIFIYPVLDPSKSKVHQDINFESFVEAPCVVCHNKKGDFILEKRELEQLSKGKIKKMMEKIKDYNYEGEFALGYLRLAISTRAYQAAKYSLTIWGLIITIFILILSLIFVQLGYKFTIGPLLNLQQVATQVAKGDLTQRIKTHRQDELGKLINAFNQMTENLESMVSKVKSGYTRLLGATQVISKSSQTVIQKAEAQVQSTDQTYNSIEQLNNGIKKINENVESLSTSSEETSSSILEMVATMEEVSKNIDALFNAVEETANATTEMVASINEVDRSMEQLASFVSDTSASMIEMDASINEVERNASQSYDFTLEASKYTEEGLKAVQETIQGMSNIQKAVQEAETVILKLGSKSEEIGKIVNVIDDIAEQTNLLALNAAILAAQAGEHGKGFSVVATEIRDLSERTASSTKEISNLIKTVQEEVKNAIESTKIGVKEAKSGASLANQSGRILEKILENSLAVSNMAKEIARATKEQARSSQ